ncbi:hypothetical protein NDU88_000575 [Pleurodeles waltl]|uniref:Uncharacterized protein n=1 Tax=Pleurodeles waltl TaxID=8319 RepID=A0AAV7U5T3_PLEWA|nr:hypothetical protein NDU88_000575 [Pleurodeles waltl]
MAYTRGCCRGKNQDGAPVPQAGFTRPGAPSGISRAVRFWDASLQLPRPRAGLEAGGGRARKERVRGRSRSSSRSAPLASLSPALHAHRGALAAQFLREAESAIVNRRSDALHAILWFVCDENPVPEAGVLPYRQLFSKSQKVLTAQVVHS